MWSPFDNLLDVSKICLWYLMGGWMLQRSLVTLPLQGFNLVLCVVCALLCVEPFGLCVIVCFEVSICLLYLLLGLCIVYQLTEFQQF